MFCQVPVLGCLPCTVVGFGAAGGMPCRYSKHCISQPCGGSSSMLSSRHRAVPGVLVYEIHIYFFIQFPGLLKFS